MCEGASKQILNLNILPRRDRAGTAPLPRFEIPGSATGLCLQSLCTDSLSIKLTLAVFNWGRNGMASDDSPFSIRFQR